MYNIVARYVSESQHSMLGCWLRGIKQFWDYTFEEDLNDRGLPISVSRESDRRARCFCLNLWLQQEAEAGLRAATCTASTCGGPAYCHTPGQSERSGKGRLVHVELDFD